MRTKIFLIGVVVVICHSLLLADPSVIMDNKQFPQVDLPSGLILNKDKAAYAKSVEAKLDVWKNMTDQIRKNAGLTPYSLRRQQLEQIAGEIEDLALDVRGELITLKLAPKSSWMTHQLPIETKLEEMRTRYNRVMAE